MMSRSEKPVVLVTGATQYTGLTVAKLFAKRGYNVVVTSRSVEKAEGAAEQVLSVFCRIQEIGTRDIRDPGRKKD